MKLIAGWVISALIALLFVFSGFQKLAAVPMVVAMFEAYGYAPWFRDLIGVLEVVAGLLILFPRTLLIGAVIVFCIMLGAIVTQVAHGQPTMMLVPIVVMVLTILAWWLRRPEPVLA